MRKMIEASHWREVDPDDWRWGDFSPQEMACRHCGAIKLDVDAMDRLQALRRELAAPMIVHSAYRCPTHNKAVGGAKRSQHMEGRAFDVSMGNHEPGRFVELAERLGFTGIGTYPKQGFVHVDDRDGDRARWGEPFAEREGRFSPEPPKRPAREATQESAKIGGAVIVAHEGAQELLPQLAPYLEPQWLTWLALGVAAVGIAAVVFRAVKGKDA